MLWLWTAHALAAPQCVDAAAALLERGDPLGHSVLVAAAKSEVTPWLVCDRGAPFDVDVAVHELVHLRGGVRGAQLERYALLLPDGRLAEIARPAGLFSRSEIVPLLRPEEVGQHVQVYLVGPSGAQDLMLLLDELNAYAWSARTAAATASYEPAGTRTSGRDGVAVFQYWLTVYLALARDAHPETVAALASPELQGLIRDVWLGAEAALEASCPADSVGIDDGYYLSRAYAPEAVAVLTSFVPGLSPVLPPSCTHRVAMATPPSPVRAGEPRTVTVQTISVRVDGEELTLEDVEKRAKKDPRYAELLERIRREHGL
jgi:hypothetical protein